MSNRGTIVKCDKRVNGLLLAAFWGSADDKTKVIDILNDYSLNPQKYVVENGESEKVFMRSQVEDLRADANHALEIVNQQLFGELPETDLRL